MNRLDDHYALLDVPRNATTEQIRARFLALARDRHPDRFTGEAKATAESAFQSLTAAFNVLSDPGRRRQYDLELLRPPAAQGAAASELMRAHLQRGVKAYREGNFAAAAGHFEHAAEADPKSASAWYNLALASGRQERTRTRALQAIERACRLEKMNATYLKAAGKLFAAAGMEVKAAQYYNEALAWGGDDPAVRRALEELSHGGAKAKPGGLGRASG